jgi:hypothetical protein
MLGFLTHSCVVNENDRAPKAAHKVSAGVEHGLGILGAVLVALEKAMQGVHHDHVGLVVQASDVIDHMLQALFGVEIAPFPA